MLDILTPRTLAATLVITTWVIVMWHLCDPRQDPWQ